MSAKVPLVIGTTTPIAQLPPGDTLAAVAMHEVAKNGTLAAARKRLNLIEGSGVTIAVADNSGQDRVDVTLSSTGGGGGGSPVVITPPQITADQDNYAPTGWDTSTTVRLSFSNNYGITSLSASGIADGHRKVLRNIGTKHAYLVSDHPNATAGNAIAGELDHILTAGGSIQIEYDAALAKWVVLDNTFDPHTHFMASLFYATMGSITAADHALLAYTGTAAVSGAASTAFAESFNAMSVTAAPTALSAIYFAKSAQHHTVIGMAYIYAFCSIQLPVLSTSTERFSVSMGLTDTLTSASFGANGAEIYYRDDTNGGRWQGVTRNASVQTSVDLGVTVSTSPTYLGVAINAARTEVRFYVNGLLAGISTTNIPANNTPVGTRTGMLKAVGSTNRTARIGRLSSLSLSM